MEYILLAIALAGFLAYVYNKSSFPDLIARKRISRAAQNAELIKVLLDLEEEPLDNLFKLYKKQFAGFQALKEPGSRPASYRFLPSYPNM
jgi:hypothetical protein